MRVENDHAAGLQRVRNVVDRRVVGRIDRARAARRLRDGIAFVFILVREARILSVIRTEDRDVNALGRAALFCVGNGLDSADRNGIRAGGVPAAFDPAHSRRIPVSESVRAVPDKEIAIADERAGHVAAPVLNDRDHTVCQGGIIALFRGCRGDVLLGKPCVFIRVDRRPKIVERIRGCAAAEHAERQQQQRRKQDRSQSFHLHFVSPYRHRRMPVVFFIISYGSGLFNRFRQRISVRTGAKRVRFRAALRRKIYNARDLTRAVVRGTFKKAEKALRRFKKS